MKRVLVKTTEQRRHLEMPEDVPTVNECVRASLCQPTIAVRICPNGAHRSTLMHISYGDAQDLQDDLTRTLHAAGYPVCIPDAPDAPKTTEADAVTRFMRLALSTPGEMISYAQDALTEVIREPAAASSEFFQKLQYLLGRLSHEAIRPVADIQWSPAPGFKEVERDAPAGHVGTRSNSEQVLKLLAHLQDTILYDVSGHRPDLRQIERQFGEIRNAVARL